MTANNILVDKTISFAIRIVNCCKFLVNDKKELVMSKQVLRSGTSIGANVHECIQAQSKADFVSKMSIALKEASETSYWLILLNKTDYISDSVFKSIKADLDEITKIIISSIKTTKKNMDYENKK
jgi:four helix bundle protein